MSIIGALLQGKFFAPMTLQGTCNTDVILIYLREILLPKLAKGTTIVMDNATFHKSSDIKKLIENAGCHLLFLPPYSPDLNPIEHWWHKIKSILRPIVQEGRENVHDILNRVLMTVE